MLAQRFVRQRTQLEFHATRIVRAGGARDGHELVDGIVHVVGQSRAVAHFAVMREIQPTRPELQ
jgi:hypothetical protein